MATPKSALSGSSKTPQILSEDQQADFQGKIRHRVSQRAHEIYQESDGSHGNDYQHWMQAENEVLQRGLEVRESGSWLALNASIPEGTADSVEICLTPANVTVRAAHGQTEREIFLTHDLNTEIEPSTASATLKDDKLTIMVKKRYPVSSAASNAATAGNTATAATGATASPAPAKTTKA